MAGPLGTVVYDSLLYVFILLAFAEILRSVAKRFRLPTLVAEVVAGIFLGGSAVGGVVNGVLHVSIFTVTPEVLLFADFSVILVIFAAGLEAGFSSLREAGGYALAAALLGEGLSFGATTLVVAQFYPIATALMVGVATGATSTAVVSYMIRHEEAAVGAPGRFLLATSAYDDVFALILLSIVLSFVEGQSSALAVTGSVIYDVAAWVTVLLVAVLLLPRVFRYPAIRESREAPFVVLFALAALVASLGFSAVVGAFIAGLALADAMLPQRTRQIADALLAVFGPLFFVVVGAQFNVGLLLDTRMLALAGLLTGMAVFGKVAAVAPVAYAKFRHGSTALAIAAGTVPRGEIGLIVGSLGIGLGILDARALGAIIVMAIVTTLIGGTLFPWLTADSRGRRGTPTPPDAPAATA